jgi:Rod binding domain-containing protein
MLDKITATPLDPSLVSGPKDSPAKVKDAARQFESLMIAQMLKSMRDSEGGWLGTGGDESSSSAMEYAQESFAQALSARGGLGLASIVEKGFEKT